jgi:hypothetical protein
MTAQLQNMFSALPAWIFAAVTATAESNKKESEHSQIKIGGRR